MGRKVDKAERGMAFVLWCQGRNYLPLDKEYRTATTKMRYLCSCGNVRAISFKRMERGETGCQPCSKARGADKRKYTIEQAREEFLGKKLKLLEQTYANANTPMRYVCLVCHVPGKMRLGSVNFGHGCKTCAERIKAAARRSSIVEAREYFEASGLLLLETVYKNNTSPMRCRCMTCDRVITMALKSVRRGSGCRNCAIRKRTGPGHHRWIEDREEARLRKKIIEKCHATLRHCLLYIDKQVPDATAELLGYSPRRLR